MSRHNKTFAPRTSRFDAQAIDTIEEQEKYTSISNQDAKISLTKTEVTQITYAPFQNRAFNKVERGSSIIKFLNNGLHVLALNKALNKLGYKAPENETFFGNKTKIALMSFQRDYGIQKSGIFDSKTLLKMDEELGKLKDKKTKNDNVSLPASLEKPKTSNSKDDDSITHTIVIAKNQKFNGKLIQTDEDLNHFAEFKMNITRRLKWNPKFTDEEVKNMVAKGASVNYKISAKENNIEKETETLSPDKKQFIRDATSTADYIQNTRILDLLKQLSDEEIADYKSKVSEETTDLNVIEESLKGYIETRNKNSKDNDELETVKTKLYGLEELYKQYIDFTKLSPTISNISSVGTSVTNISKEYEPAKKKLTQAMIANGFASIEEFKTYITRYETAFETETVRIGVEKLQNYKHTLYEENKKLNDDVFLNTLLQGITRSEAKQNFEDAKTAKKAASASFADKPNQDQKDSGNRMITEANQKETQGNTAISSLFTYTPLVKDEKFDREAFSKITNKKDLKAFLYDYILSQTQNVDSVINNIQENPEHIYELDKLYTLSYTKQDIKENSIYNSIITGKYKRLKELEILLAICQGVFAAALIAATWGAATPILIAGGALSLAMSIDIAYDTINEYKNNKEFHDVGLLTDDPSLFWVVVAIAGVGLDAGILAVVLRSAKPIAAAAKSFNKAEDATEALAKLESDLIRIKSLDTRVQQNILRQAELKGEIKEALKIAKSSLFTTNMMVNPEFAIKLLPLAIKYIKSGVLSFEKFLIELQTAKIIKEIEKLSPEELSLLKKTFEEAGKKIPRLDETTKFWNVTNQAGTELRWTNIREKDLEKSIDAALKSQNSGKNWEGEVARELSKYDEITDFSNEFKIIENGTVKNIAGDIDVGSSKYIIECKESISHNTLTTKTPDGSYKFLNQFDKYLNQNNIKYINIKNRQVVLVIKNFGKNTDISHPILKQLQDKGVIVITDLNQIKNLK